jgi:hypothetical protein
MTITTEEIMAYVDGEMDESARTRITLAALADGALAARIAAERALRDQLRAHFAPIAEAPVPAEWLTAIRSATAPAEVIDLAAVRARKAATQPSVRAGWWRSPWAGAAIAASLVLGVFAGSEWQSGQSADGPILARNGALMASGDLAKTLDTQLASAQDGAPVRMLGTFRRAGGDVCRAFSGQQASGIACHDAGGWRLQHILPGSTPGSAAYQQAGSNNAALMTIAQGMAAGDPFGADQEREAKAKGWR